MVAVLERPQHGNKILENPQNLFPALCWNPRCAPDGSRKVLGQFEKGSTGTFFKRCERCKSWNVVDLTSLC